MAFYDRLLGYAYPKINVHHAMAFLREYVRGKATAAQTWAALSLDASEQTEATGLYNAIMSGNSALITTGTNVASRWQRSWEVEEIICLGEFKKAPYDSVAAVKTRLGV